MICLTPSTSTKKLKRKMRIVIVIAMKKMKRKVKRKKEATQQPKTVKLSRIDHLTTTKTTTVVAANLSYYQAILQVEVLLNRAVRQLNKRVAISSSASQLTRSASKSHEESKGIK